ncbi:MAG TPA: restriction endonuclease [Bacteroidales bacterium]|nr:restriction endonuclease [Bacteroidales bacterium]
MKKPSLQEFDITAEQYSQYQLYKTKIENREIGREEFGHRFYETFISVIAIIFILLLLIVARVVLLNTATSMIGSGKYVGLFLFILVILILSALLFFVVKMFVAKPFRPKLKQLKIYRPFKKLYIKFQPSIHRELYFDNAKRYELQNEAYYNYIGDLQRRFPGIIEFNYNLQSYLKKIIDEIVSYEHIETNNSIINKQLENRRAVWLKMDGVTFEREVASIYREHGYEAKTTKATGEGGVDIRLWKDGQYSIAQCKNVRHQIDAPAVRKLLETANNEKASKAILICSAGYTPKAKEFAKWKSIELLDLNQFLMLVNNIYPLEYQLVDAIVDTSVTNSNTTYNFKVIGKTEILYSSHTHLEDTNYCLFETLGDAKKTIRRLQRIDKMPLASEASYNVEEWWLESIPRGYYRKPLYYIKVSEKELKTTANKRKEKEKRDGQRKIWTTEQYVQKSMWENE